MRTHGIPIADYLVFLRGSRTGMLFHALVRANPHFYRLVLELGFEALSNVDSRKKLAAKILGDIACAGRPRTEESSDEVFQTLMVVRIVPHPTNSSPAEAAESPSSNPNTIIPCVVEHQKSAASSVVSNKFNDPSFSKRILHNFDNDIAGVPDIKKNQKSLA